MSVRDIYDQYPKFIADKLRWLEYTHMPKGLPREVSKKFCFLAYDYLDAMMEVQDIQADKFAIDQMLIALQRIIDAKDAAVRSAISVEHES